MKIRRKIISFLIWVFRTKEGEEVNWFIGLMIRVFRFHKQTIEFPYDLRTETVNLNGWKVSLKALNIIGRVLERGDSVFLTMYEGKCLEFREIYHK